MLKFLLRCLLVLFLVSTAMVTSTALGGSQPKPNVGIDSSIKRLAAREIDEDSLVAMVRFLSTKNSFGELRSRFVLREDDLKEVADSLCVRLERYTGGTAHRFPFTFEEKRFSPNDSTYTSENLVVRVPGTGRIDGLFIVSGHYDAIAHRTPGWQDDWQHMPAPGADDNGTGVATIMELARIIEPNTLPFDVLFVLFSAEELGRLGSEDFVANYDLYIGEDIIADITVDMIGYNGKGERGCALFSDYESGWLADWLEEISISEFPGFDFEIFKPSLGNSDHASFWDAGYNAVCFVEPGDEFGITYYPYYHTVQDTMGWIDFSQVKMVAQTIRDFFISVGNDTIPDYSILSSDIFLQRGDYPTSRKVFAEGDTLSLKVMVRNKSIAMSDVPPSIRLNVEVSNQNGTRTIYDGDIEPPSPLKATEVLIPLDLERSDAGENVVTARISIDGIDNDPSNNTSSMHFKVGSTSVEPVVLSNSMVPNPVTCPIKDASFCINLSSEVDLMLEIFTMEGESVGTAFIGNRWGVELGPGQSCFKIGDIIKDMPELSSGIYPYRLVLYRNGTVIERLNGKFAVLR